MNIRIVSPSGAIDPRFIDGAVVRLQNWGHQVSVAPHAKDRYGALAGTDANRIEDINSAFRDPTIDAVLCARGGYGLQRIIDRIEPTEKLIIGFSDISELHQLMRVSFPEQVSVHGPMCKHIATWNENCESLRYLRQLLEGYNLKYELPTNLSTRFAGRKNGDITYAEGTLVGGNLSVLYGLQATKFGLSAIMKPQEQSFNANGQLSSNQKYILFLEDIAEQHYHIDRMMNNLRMSGVLSNLSALIIGQFTACQDDWKRVNGTIESTILDAVSEYDYPVIFGFPAGHDDVNLPMVFGKTLKLTISNDKTIFEQ